MLEQPRGMPIFEAYELYRNNKLFINRRYQRKLVWTKEEKKELIKSIVNQYPVPLILLATSENGYEIIDGMQRLNAIFGFIENEFPIDKDEKELYFSTKDFTFAQAQVDAGNFTLPANVENISQKAVSSFISYPLPVTIFKSGKEDEINETFRLINSTGKKLSPQEVRQAGNTSNFSILVRELASEIREDATRNILSLQEMPEISIDSKTTKHKYGVVAENTFWCKHGVMNTSGLRESEDEQIIADLVLSCVLGRPFPASRTEFDNYYGSGKNDRSAEIELKINAMGLENIKKDIMTVFSEIVTLSDSYLGDGRLKALLNPNAGGNPVKEAFYTLFMAFYQLIIIENKEPHNWELIVEKLHNIHKKLKKSANYTTTKDRTDNINICRGLIQDFFKASSSTFRSSTSYILDFRGYLQRSKSEAATYDFKQGFYTLDPKIRKFDDKSFEKIMKSISALANLGKDKFGYLFVGVTDKEEDTKSIEKLDKISGIPRFHQFGIAGIEREADLKGVSLDQYISFILSKIRGSDLDEALKSSVTKEITPITYDNKTVLMIKVPAGKEPVYYKDSMYQRDGDKTVEVKGKDQANIYKLF